MNLAVLAATQDLWELRARAVRELARRNLLHFTNYTYPKYKADPVHRFIAGKLDRVMGGELSRLIVTLAPQHGKSELVSRRLPAFWVAHYPELPVILSSYAAALAHSMSRHARGIVESQEFAELFPDIKTDPDSRSVQQWEIAGNHTGGIVSAGVGGPVVGHGAALGVIDDPFENWKQAQSQLMRDSVWDWWKGTFRPRVWEDGAVVIISTRWHEDDLIGRLVQEQPGQWEIVRLPAVAEDQETRDRRNTKLFLPMGLPDPLGRNAGEPLAPSLFSLDALAEIQRDVGSYVWAAEYCGSPEAYSGNRFKRHWFQIVDEVPADIPNNRRGRYWDLAATGDGTGARTAGVLMSVKDGIIYIEHAAFGRWTTHPRNATMRQTAEMDHGRYGNHGRCWIEQEPGSSGKDAMDAIIRFLAGFSVHPDRPSGDKDTRLEPFAAQAEAGNVRLIRGSWNGEYIEELCSVPVGRTRDMADATAGIFNMLCGKRVTVSRVT